MKKDYNDGFRSGRQHGHLCNPLAQENNFKAHQALTNPNIAKRVRDYWMGYTQGRDAKVTRPRHRFKVIEYSSFYAVRDTTTGKEHPMGDGVDTLFTPTGKAMRCGTEHFRKTWERSLNANPSETEEAYFPQR